MSRRPKTRHRKVQPLTPELIELFRKALPHEMGRRRKLTDEGFAAIQAFNLAIGRKPWEHSPLSPHASNKPLQAALLARLTPDEQKAWQAYVRQWQKRYEGNQAAPARRKQRQADMPRQELWFGKLAGG